MPTDRVLYRREGGTSLIEIRLSSIHQLFDSLDPAPFPERSLDTEAEEYIIASARDSVSAVMMASRAGKSHTSPTSSSVR